MKKVLIIGAGISGLSAGIYARQNGFKTEILEMNSFIGGECTGFLKDNYYFDNSIEYLCGTKEGTNMNKVWNQLGIFNNLKIYYDEYISGYRKEEKTLLLYRDKEKFKKNMINISKIDIDEIEDFFNLIEKFMESDRIRESYKIDNLNLKLKMTRIKSRLRKISLEEYLGKFNSPIIKKALMSIVPKGDVALSFFERYADYCKGNLAYPEGGGLRIALRLERTFKELGGKVNYCCKVEEFIIDNKEVIGVKLYNGKIIKCDYIISAVDCKTLLNKFLKKRYKDRILDYQYKNNKLYPIYTAINIQFGVDCDLSNYFNKMIYDVEPFLINKNIIDELMISLKAECEGKSIIRVIISGNYYDFFKGLKENSLDAYNNEIANIMEHVIKRIINIYPKVDGKMECYVITTPIDYERNFGAFRGSFKSFMRNRNSKDIKHNGKIAGIKNLYVAGQWSIMPGGVHLAAISGKIAVERLCKEVKLKFKYHI